LGIASYWMNSYWGGAVAATGAALVLGAMARLHRKARTREALLLGAGLAILANSRPYEGLLLCMPVAFYFFRWLFSRTPSHDSIRERIAKVLVPLAVVVSLTGIFMGYYNWRLTGNAFLLPHRLNMRTYNSRGLFVWEHAPKTVQYHNQQFEDFYNGWEREDYANTWADFWRVSAEKGVRFGSTYFWWGAMLLLPGLAFVFRDKKMRLLLAILFIVIPGLFVVIWSMPHYAAPLTCVIFALLVQAMRHLQTMRIAGRPIGTALSGAAVFLLLTDTTTAVQRRACDGLLWTCEGDQSREIIQKELSRRPGKHLVIVRYEPDHNIHDEWVYDGAEIDGAKVVWARELDPEQNAKLIAYFKDRRVWLVEPDTDNTELVPYRPVGSNSSKDDGSDEEN